MTDLQGSSKGAHPAPTLGKIAREWTRIGSIGFGGPPAHIALLRRTCVETERWIDDREFEDGVAATSLLPGPASTQLAIFCAWRLRGTAGALVGGFCFIVPGLALILVLAAVFLSGHPPDSVLGAAAGAGAAVPAVALNAARLLAGPSWARATLQTAQRVRWVLYAAIGAAAAATIGPYLVVVLLGCGFIEFGLRMAAEGTGGVRAMVPLLVGHATTVRSKAGLAWIALKVGALSYGGGFVIVPLMQHDAVTTYHFMTGAQFLNAVALGQVTPGPVVQTVAVVGYAAAGVGGGLLAALIAFAPSFLFVLVVGPRFDQIRTNASMQSFLAGAGPAVIGAIAGSAIPLGLALGHLWQLGLLGLAAIWLLALRRNVIVAIVASGVIGALAVLAGAPVAR